MTDGDPRLIDTTSIVHDAVAVGRSSNQRWRMATLVLGLVCVAALTFAVMTILGQRDDAQSQTQVERATTKKVGVSGTDLANKVLLACVGAGKDARALRSAGLCGEATTTKQEIKQAVPGTPGAAGATGATGSTGLPGVRGQDGSPGPAGRDGASVTGPTGATGPAGPAGPPGADGKAGSDGAPGPAGPAGPAGADGRGIRDAQCGDNGRWTITYTDGTTSDGGTCRADLIPAPSQ